MKSSQEDKQPRPLNWTQWFLYHVNRFLCRFIWRVSGPRELPVSVGQGAVLIGNHRCSVDPCFIQYAAGRRPVHWMVAALYSPRSFLGRVLAGLETISIGKRGQDIGALKAAVRYAESGELVGMMPEGVVNREEAFMKPIRPGAVVVALSAGVPIIPCYIADAPYHKVPWRPLFKFARVRVKVGAPIDLSEHWGQQGDSKLVGRLAIQCVQEIAKLAGRHDFEPKLAGRKWKDWSDDENHREESDVAEPNP